MALPLGELGRSLQGVPIPNAGGRRCSAGTASRSRVLEPSNQPAHPRGLFRPLPPAPRGDIPAPSLSTAVTASPTTTKSPVTPYQIVTDRIVGLLESGVVPWKASWKRPPGQVACSLVSRKPYRGINHFLLDVIAHVNGYGSPYWLSFRQALELGGHVRKGEKGAPCFFWKVYDGKANPEEQPLPSDDQSARKRFVARYYTVFSLDQCEGIAAPVADEQPLPKFNPIKACEQIVAGYHGPTVDQGNFDPCYVPQRDRVRMPNSAWFESPESYYATLFHEVGHSTGHSSRLARFATDTAAPFGSNDYSKEELIAEMTAAFLCAEAGILPASIEDHAGYIGGWLKMLRNDNRMVVMAAAQAEKATDLVLGRTASTAE